MRFQYKAKASDGSIQQGTLEARDATQAQQRLRDRFEALLELTPQVDKNEPPIRVSPELTTHFFRRLATMIGAGLPLAQSLEYLSQSESDLALASVIQKIFDQVSAGARLSVAMSESNLRLVFSRVMIGLVQLGEDTGALVDSLTRIAELCEAQLRLRRAVISALTYPAFLFMAILAMGLFFTLVLAPGDSSLFSELGSQLPWPTAVMIGLSKMIRNPFWVAASALLLVLAVLALRHLMHSNQAFRHRLHSKALRLPIVGPLITKTVSAQMLYVIACSLQVGMATSGALKLAREVCTNLDFLERFDAALADFRLGTDLAEALESHAVFPRLVLSMIHLGMEVGNLELVLAKISQLYEEEVTSALMSATQLAEPILLAFAGAMSAFLALATLLPIINVVNTL